MAVRTCSAGSDKLLPIPMNAVVVVDDICAARLTSQITGGQKQSEEQAALFAVRVNLPC